MHYSAGRKNMDCFFLHDIDTSYARQQNDFGYIAFFRLAKKSSFTMIVSGRAAVIFRPAEFKMSRIRKSNE